jgi:hypothetical protein
MQTSTYVDNELDDASDPDNRQAMRKMQIQVYEHYRRFGTDHIFKYKVQTMNPSCTWKHGFSVLWTFHDVQRHAWLQCPRVSSNGREH